MALVIEDGTIVAGANSFVTVAELRSYADIRNITLPDANSAVEALLIKAMDYIELKEPLFSGARTSALQDTPFPRTGCYVNGGTVGINTIPNQLKRAQIQLALDANEGIELTPNTSGAKVKREKIGPIETEYETSAESGNGSQPELTAANGWLSMFYSNGSGGINFRTARL